MYNVHIAIAKTNKYATPESGDTVEVVERPHGGFSVVLADGQGSGRAAKNLSNLVTTKAISMIKDGARDGAVARSVHDYLFTYRSGKVSATLVIVTIDLATRTLVLSRNSHCPIILWRPDEHEISLIESPSSPIGIYSMTKPAIIELPLAQHTYVVTYTDGVMEAGARAGRPLDLPAIVREKLEGEDVAAHDLADYLLELALEADARRPADDMTVLVLAVVPSPDPEVGHIVPEIRRLEMDIPLS